MRKRSWLGSKRNAERRTLRDAPVKLTHCSKCREATPASFWRLTGRSRTGGRPGLLAMSTAHSTFPSRALTVGSPPLNTSSFWTRSERSTVPAASTGGRPATLSVEARVPPTTEREQCHVAFRIVPARAGSLLEGSDVASSPSVVGRLVEWLRRKVEKLLRGLYMVKKAAAAGNGRPAQDAAVAAPRDPTTGFLMSRTRRRSRRPMRTRS